MAKFNTRGGQLYPMAEGYASAPKLLPPEAKISVADPDERPAIPPEGRLALAVLAQAVVDAKGIIAASLKPDTLKKRHLTALILKRRARDLLQWLRDDSLEEYTLDWWCMLTGKDPVLFRGKMLALYEKPLVEARTILGEWYHQQRLIRSAPLRIR